MATFKYFSDITGEAVELGRMRQMRNAEFASRWPGIKGLRADSFTKWVAHPLTGTEGLQPVTRMIEMKRYPSRHVCNSKCMGGNVNGACECQCGGKNHGRGIFTDLIAAA